MEKAEAYDERFEEVGWGHTTCEGGEQGSASFCGVAGGKGLNQGESGLPKHVPNPVSGKRATGGGPDTESFCRQSPEVGAGWFNDHVRICAGGAQQCAFLPQRRGFPAMGIPTAIFKRVRHRSRPSIFAREQDMCPSERRDVRQELRGNAESVALALRDSMAEVKRVPVNHDGGKEVQL